MSDVLVCVDFSDASAPALRAAAGLTRTLGGTLHLLHVAAEEPALAGYDHDPVATFNPEDRARQLLDEHHDLRDEAASLAENGLDVRPLLVMGPTVETILAEAERLGVEWIVVGTHGHSGLRHLLLGSVAEGLIRRADRPVVVVPLRAASAPAAASVTPTQEGS